MTEFQEWPKMVEGRPAKDAAEAVSFLSHEADCPVHEKVWADRFQKFVDRHPDVGAACTCGGHTPDPKKLTHYGLNPFNGADPAKFDHDQSGAPGGSKPKKARKPKATA